MTPPVRLPRRGPLRWLRDLPARRAARLVNRLDREADLARLRAFGLHDPEAYEEWLERASAAAETEAALDELYRPRPRPS